MYLKADERTGRGALIISCLCKVFQSVHPVSSQVDLRAGKDAARAFATGCFATHQTHDTRGLSEKEMKVRSRN